MRDAHTLGPGAIVKTCLGYFSSNFEVTSLE